MSGTKKQKLDITKAIVEAIYSKEPPGRFLKKCPETGQWKQLSKREAADKAAQAMAYAVRGESSKHKKKERRRRSRTLPSWTLPSSPQDEKVGAASASSHTSDQTTDNNNNRLEECNNDASSSVEQQFAARGSEAARTNDTDSPSPQPQHDAGTALTSNTSDHPTNDNNKHHLEGGINDASSAEHQLAAHGSAAARTNNAESPSSQPQHDTWTASQTSDQPTNNHLEGNAVSSVEHRLDAHVAIDSNNAESAVNDGHDNSAANELELPFPENSLLQQHLQPSSGSNLPTAAGAPLNVNQNVLAQVLAQAHHQQRHHHQQQQQQHHLQQLRHLILQYTLGQHLLGQLQRTQQLPLLEGLVQLLAQTQQQHQQLLPQHVLDQISLNFPNSPQSQHLSPAYFLSMLSNLQSHPNIGTSNSPQQAQQMDQVQRSLARQQQQLLVLSLITSNQLLIQQQQHPQQQHPPPSLDPQHQTRQSAVRRRIQNPQSLPPVNAQPSANNAADASDMQEESDDG